MIAFASGLPKAHMLESTIDKFSWLLSQMPCTCWRTWLPPFFNKESLFWGLQIIPFTNLL